jgi:hypothetical protein
MKTNAKYQAISAKKTDIGSPVISDEIIKFTYPHIENVPILFARSAILIRYKTNI